MNHISIKSHRIRSECSRNPKSISPPQSDHTSLGLAAHLENLNQFLHRLASSEPVVSGDFNPISCSESREWYKNALLRFPDYLDIVQILPRRYTYKPYLNVFIEYCEEMHLCGGCIDWRLLLKAPEHHYDCLNGMSVKQVFKQLVISVYNQCHSLRVCNAMSRLLYESNKRYVEYCQYVDELYRQVSRMIVLRVDLCYQKTLTHTIMLEDVSLDVSRLLRTTTYRPEFLGMKGYIAKIEYGIERGIHCHATFFFDGSVRNPGSHVHHAKLIGELWSQLITKGKGIYWNVNDQAVDFERLNRCGIGAIEWHDLERRQHLQDYVIRYACKPEQIIHLKNGRRVRSFRRGVSPKQSLVKNGRPRRCQTVGDFKI